MRNRILEASADWFFKKPYKDVNLNEIAVFLGISKKTIYNHFSGKRELFLETIDCYSQIQIDKVRELCASVSDYIPKIKAVLQFAHNHTALNMRNVQLWDDVPQVDSDALQKRLGERIFVLASELVDEGIEKGYFRKDLPAKACVLVIISLIRSHFDRETRFFGTEVPEDFAGFVEKVLFEGMMTDEGIEQYRNAD